MQRVSDPHKRGGLVVFVAGFELKTINPLLGVFAHDLTAIGVDLVLHIGGILIG